MKMYLFKQILTKNIYRFYSSIEQMIREKKGKSVKIIHYVGDKYWNLNKDL